MCAHARTRGCAREVPVNVSDENEGVKMDLTNVEKQLGFTLRDFQSDALEKLAQDRNLIVSAPTGAGKTAIYLGASIGLDGVTVIVYPLISLIQDQERRFTERGFEFASFYGNVTGKRRQRALEAVANGDARIVLTTPETLNGNKKIQDAILTAGGCSLMAIDEVHVIEDWSNTFRPQYRRLGKTARAIRAERVLMCSATVTPEAALDACTIFGRWDFDVIALPSVRENLNYMPVPIREAGRQLAIFVEDDLYESPGIIYCTTVYRLNQVASAVDDWLGRKIIRYHGQLSPGARKSAQKKWTEADDEWVIATKAFGMGIDKQDVRSIVHHELPSSLVDYAQETGRAGRDGKDSWCWLNSSDNAASAEYLTMSNYPPLQDIKRVFEFISDRCPGGEFVRLPNNEIARGLGWFDKQAAAKVRTCRGWLSGTGLIAGRKASPDYTIDVYPETIEKVSERERKLILALKRTGQVEDFDHGGFRVVARRDRLASICESVYSQWQNKLRQFDRSGLILYQAPDKASEVKVLSREWKFDAQRLIRSKARAKERLQEMRAFNSLPTDQRPAAIERAIGMEAERVREDLERAAQEHEVEQPKPTKKRTARKAGRGGRRSKKANRTAAELMGVLDEGASGWVDSMNVVGDGKAALFCVDSHGNGEFGFYIVFGEVAKKLARDRWPGYPVYTFVEANHLAKMERDDRFFIHKMMAQFDGEYMRVLDELDACARSES